MVKMVVMVKNTTSTNIFGNNLWFVHTIEYFRAHIHNDTEKYLILGEIKANPKNI